MFVQLLLVAAVQQFDCHLPSLTVRETLRFNAAIKLPRFFTKQQRNWRVETVVDTLGLRLCADTRVGGEALKGVSGGEKRRLSIGVQMLSDPAVCILDEPTTGELL